MKVLIHTDLDGKACGAILTRRFPDADLINYNYFYEPDRSIDLIETDEEVIFADITPKPEHLAAVMTITKRITIFDHHSSSLRDLTAAGLTFPGTQTKDGLGACLLVWEYYYPERPVPSGIRWIAEYDAWERTADNKMFNFGLKKFNIFPTNWIWNKILLNDEVFVDKVMSIGRELLAYLVPWYKRLVRSYAITGYVIDDVHDKVPNRYSAILLNQGAVDSSVFDDADKPYDIYIRAVFGKNLCWLVSITTNRDDIDVSEIANQFGGGGHRKAAGFAIDDLFDFFVPHASEISKCIDLPKADQMHA